MNRVQICRATNPHGPYQFAVVIIDAKGKRYQETTNRSTRDALIFGNGICTAGMREDNARGDGVHTWPVNPEWADDVDPFDAEKETQTVRASITELAKLFVLRANAQDMKGKARDRAALEFFMGAYSHAVATKSPSESQLSVAAMLIATRGYSEVQHIATRPE